MSVNVYPVPVYTLGDLIHHAGDLAPLYIQDNQRLTGILSVSDQLGKGAFKIAKKASLNVADDATKLPLDPNALAAKEFFQPRPTDQRPITFEPKKACELTIGEVNLNIWASSLMGLVYDFIEEFLKKNDTPARSPPAIPRFRFVRVAYAVSTTTPQRHYILEELLPEAGWIKYIHNGSSRVMASADESSTESSRGSFLSFSQHVQYQESGKLIFVADLQGMYQAQCGCTLVMLTSDHQVSETC